MINYKKLFSLLYIFFIAGIFIAITLFFFSNNCFYEDDSHYAIGSLKKALDFKTEHGSGYLGLFLCKFFCTWFPINSYIHPADYICSIHYSLIKSCFIIFIFLNLAKFILFFKKTEKIAVNFFTFILCYFYYAVFSSQSHILMYNYSFYRYCFSLIFFSWLIYFIFKNSIENEKKINVFQLFCACFCAYVTGSSSEILFMIAFIFSVLAIFYNLIIKRKIMALKIFLPFTVLSYTIYNFATNWEFIFVATQLRGLDNINFKLNDLITFLSYYFKIFFLNEFIYWILFSIILIAIIKKQKSLKQIISNEKIIIPFLFLLSILLVYLSLFFCGENGFTYNIYPSCGYFIGHRNLVFLYKMIILMPMFFYLSYLFQIQENLMHKFKKILFISFIVLLITLITYDIKAGIKYSENNNSSVRKFLYKWEKSYRYQVLKGIKPLIFVYEPYTSTQWWYQIKGKKDVKSYFTDYMSQIYKNYKIEVVPFDVETDKDKEEEYYEKIGLKFSDEEMKNLKFQRLYDDKYVLNGLEN